MKSILKKAREAKGLKTREVSEMLQIDQALISKFESGQRRPTRDQILKLAALLGIDTEVLLLAWLKEKIVSEIAGEELGLKALEEVLNELNPKSAPTQEALDELFEEMNALKNKMENLRNPKIGRG